MLRSLAIACVLVTPAAAEAPPQDPGDPPDLARIPTSEVAVVFGKAVWPAQVFLTGHDAWTLTATAGTAKLTIDLGRPAKLAKGVKRGAGATLEVDGKKQTGSWVVEMDGVNVGYLKMPGTCSGKLAASFGLRVYVTGTFSSAGCISYRQP